MASNTNDHPKPGSYFITDEGDVFISLEYADRIAPVTSGGHVIFVRDCISNQPIGSRGEFACTLVTRGDEPFVALNYLNRLLLQPNNNNNTRRLVLAIQKNEKGDQRVVLRLENIDGSETRLTDPMSVDHGHLQDVPGQQGASSISSGQIAGHIRAAEQLEAEAEGDSLVCQGTPGHREQDQGQGQGHHSRDSSQHSRSARQDENHQDESVVSQHVDSSAVARREGSLCSPEEGQKFWRALRDMQMTDFEVLKALSKNTLPKALSDLANDFCNVIPFARLPEAAYGVKLFDDPLQVPMNLGIPAGLDDTSFWDRHLLPKIKEFRTQLARLRNILYSDEFDPNTSNAPHRKAKGHFVPTDRARQDAKRIDDILAAITNAPHDSMIGSKNELSEIVEYYVKVFGPKYSNSDGYEVALAVKNQADYLWRYYKNWNHYAEDLGRHKVGTRLLRRVVPSKKLSGSGPVEHPLPTYVLPLGRLCRLEGCTRRPKELDEVLVMDVTSPRKALWRFGFSKESAPCCYSFEMLAADIEQTCLHHDADSEQGYMVPADGTMQSRWRTEAQIRVRYPDSRVDVEPGDILFSYSIKAGFTAAIRSGWRAAEPTKTGKRKGEDVEPRGSKRKISEPRGPAENRVAAGSDTDVAMGVALDSDSDSGSDEDCSQRRVSIFEGSSGVNMCVRRR